MDYDPNAPAFGADAQKVEDLNQPEESKIDSVEEEIAEESAVPYSRFKKFHSLAKEREAEADALRAELQQLKSHDVDKRSSDEEKPFTEQEWIEIYGDSEISKKGYQKMTKMFDGYLARSEAKALEAIENRTSYEQQRIEQNVEVIDSELEALNDYAGKDLSEAEQSAILDIIDDYSPKDRNGNYLSNIPFEKAYDIYELQERAGKGSKIESRNKVASLVNSKSGGAPTFSEEDKNFVPGDWGSAARRYSNN